MKPDALRAAAIVWAVGLAPGLLWSQGTAPQAVSVSPSSGNGRTQTFSLVYSDPNGANDLVSLEVSFSANDGTGECYVEFSPALGYLWLSNDDSTWLGPVTPGAAASLQNSQCTVNTANSTATASGNNYTLNLALTFQPGFTGTKNIYAYAESAATLNSGWQQLGTWIPALAQPPQPVSVTPSSGGGPSQTFSFVYSDANGAADLTDLQAVFNTAAIGVDACYIRVDPSRGVVSLANDGLTNWLGPIPLGAAGTLQNSQCALNGAGSSLASSGNLLTLNLAVTFQAGFIGVKNVYAYAQNAGGIVSGWPQLGTWTPSLINQPPQPVSVTPSSGSGLSQTFSFVYSDPNGAGDLADIQVVINTAAVGAGACYIRVDPTRGSASLANGGLWLGPITLGTAGTLQNSQCTLNGAGSSLASSGNLLTLNLALTFQAAFIGPKNIYAYAKNASGLISTWPQLGTWTPSLSNQPPLPISVTPSSGAGLSQTFSFVYSDPNGARDVADIQAVINTAANGVGACYIRVDPTRGFAFLADDGLTSWLGPIPLGAAGSLQNSQCILNGTGSSLASSGNLLTLNLALTFQAGFTGVKNVYAYAQNASGLISGWPPLGTWTASLSNQPPQPISVTPSSGSGLSQIFSFVYSDARGAGDLADIQAVINTSAVGVGACYIDVDPTRGSASLANDGLTGWLSPIPLAAAGTLQNSQCILDGASSSLVLSGNTLTLNLAITFQAGFIGTKNVYGYAKNAGGIVSGWPQLGTWTVSISNQPPQPVSVSPSSGSGLSQTFSLVYSDPNGARDIADIQAVINTAAVGVGACYIRVDPTRGLASLANDGLTGWLGPISLGAAGTLQNSQCILNGAGSSLASAGNLLTLNLALTFQPGFTGAKNVYAYAQNARGIISGWPQLGIWTVSISNQPPQPVSVTPSSGSGLSQIFSFVYSDSNGTSDLADIQAVINTAAVGVGACYIRVDPTRGFASLANDGLTGWLGPISLGAAGSLKNSQCALNGAGSSLASSGHLLTLNLALTFQPGFTGTKSVYAYAQNVRGLISSWPLLGTWTPQ